jgi:hypothetical protein
MNSKLFFNVNFNLKLLNIGYTLISDKDSFLLSHLCTHSVQINIPFRILNFGLKSTIKNSITSKIEVLLVFGKSVESKNVPKSFWTSNVFDTRFCIPAKLSSLLIFYSRGKEWAGIQRLGKLTKLASNIHRFCIVVVNPSTTRSRVWTFNFSVGLFFFYI